MDNSALASVFHGAQMTEMETSKQLLSTGFGQRKPGHVVVKDLELRPILITFPIGEDGELWPWLVRVTVHVMDRSGNE